VSQLVVLMAEILLSRMAVSCLWDPPEPVLHATEQMLQSLNNLA